MDKKKELERDLRNDKDILGPLWYILVLLCVAIWVVYSIIHEGFWHYVFSSDAFFTCVKVAFLAVVAFGIVVALFLTIMYLIRKEIYKRTYQDIKDTEEEINNETTEDDNEEDPVIIIPVDQMELVFFEKSTREDLTLDQVKDFESKVNSAIIDLMRKYREDDISINGTLFEKYDDCIIAGIYYQRNINIGGVE